MKNDVRNIEYLKRIVVDLPADYNDVLNKIKHIVTEGTEKNDDTQIIESAVGNIITGLKNNGWFRRHVYLLLHELLTNYRDLYEDFDIFLLELDSVVIGYIDAKHIEPYADEKAIKNLVDYVRGYQWL